MTARSSHLQPIRLFRNAWLEKLTVVSPVAFGVIWGMFLPFLVWMGWGTVSVAAAFSLVVAGLWLWTLFEYAMHRFLFHLRLKWKPLQAFTFIMHGNHHASPNDRLRNMMPPIVSVPIAAAVWYACVSMVGPGGDWLFLGFISGYVVYDFTHFACHQWPMRGRMARAIKQHHMRHHHISEHGNYAITTPLWDRLFGTAITSTKPGN